MFQTNTTFSFIYLINRYRALNKLEDDRDVLILKHMAFYECPSKDHCPFKDCCMEIFIHRLLSTKAHRSVILSSYDLRYYPVYTEQKLSGSQSEIRSGLRSGRCMCLHRTFIVQYNKAHHIVGHCSVIVTLQST